MNSWRTEISNGFEVIPAIDIRGGNCVRLLQGDYAQETVYSEDPVSVAKQFEDAGAKRLHIIDLDGSREGYPVNIAAIEKMIGSVGIPVQVGGGVRNENAANDLYNAGASRVYMGTAAIQNPEIVKALCQKHGSDAVIIAIDARDGKVAVNGWLEGTEVSAQDLAQQMREDGVTRILFTDISRDGTLSGPNLDSVQSMVETSNLKVIAAGGIASAEHIRNLSDVGAEGAVIGKAIYTGEIDLHEIFQAY